jgi:hypothetical protein
VHICAHTIVCRSLNMHFARMKYDKINMLL